MSEQVTSSLEPCISVPLHKDTLETITDQAKDWALMHGVAMRNKNAFSKDSLQFAPFALFPSSFPRSEFNKALSIQPLLNELTHKVAHNAEFLREALATTLSADPFTRRLFNIWETIRAEGITQPISLGMLRSDIMLETGCPQGKCHNAHKPYCCWKQVEINSIASGFGHLGPISRALQSFILQQLGHGDKIKNLPENDALGGLCSGLIAAWEKFSVPNAVILFIIEDITYNICDQRFHEFQISQTRGDIKVIRRTLTEVHKTGMLNNSKQLIIDNLPVAVVYYRAGYTPDHYHTEAEWDARLLIERSSAIKCPSIHYHLAGTKKVQQCLARPGALEKFLEPDKASTVREIFTGLYSLDMDSFGDAAVKMALKNPEKFVMKPQREGGGNNVYGKDIKNVLEKIADSPERSGYILMERINPPTIKGYLVRPGLPPHLGDFVSELGIFGVIIGTEDEIMVNKQVGHMLRTKLSDVNEGGVAAGSGALDSPYLIDS